MNADSLVKIDGFQYSPFQRVRDRHMGRRMLFIKEVVINL